jgi:hypothetical protein
MAKANTEWAVLPHGPIEKLTDNLWRVEGSLPRMSLKRVMTIARLKSGKLVVHNAIALDEKAMKEVEAWGTPAYLIIPSGYHRLDAPAFKKRYPSLRILTPKGARAKVEEVIAVDGTYEDFPKDDASVRFEMLAGVKESEGAMLVTSTDGLTVVLTDVVFNMDKKTDFLGWFFTTILGSAPGPRVSRLMKLVVVNDKAALRADLERLAATHGLTRLVVAHEKVASGPSAADALRTAAAML